jgi:hypothetical protein
VAVVCFGPLALALTIGLWLVPIWVSRIERYLNGPERLSRGALQALWESVWPIGMEVVGFLGLIGLFRLLALLHHDASVASKRVTLAMIIVALTALLAYDLSVSVESWLIGDWAFYVMLPFIGAVWLLFATRKVLLARVW